MTAYGLLMCEMSVVEVEARGRGGKDRETRVEGLSSSNKDCRRQVGRIYQC
jgi:hypothetical protein